VKRIICIGNRLIAGDTAGFRVFEQLSGQALPKGIEVVDGGLGGLDLLRFIEGAEQVVFVDSTCGFGTPGQTVVLRTEDVAALAEGAYSHGAGLPYLLRVLPHVCQGPIPAISVVGMEGEPSRKTIEEAADLAVDILSGSRAFQTRDCQKVLNEERSGKSYD
jgi:hydrogenase maturation protease